MSQAELQHKVFHDPRYFIAFGCGSGLLPWMPGTWGTLLAVPLYLLLAGLNVWVYLAVVIVFAALAAWLSDVLSKEMGTHDDPGMNIDEFVGYLVTMILAPHSWIAVLLGFALFRLFDIWKPWPIGWVDKNVTGGVGMILDDVLAGIAAAIFLRLIWLMVG